MSHQDVLIGAVVTSIFTDNGDGTWTTSSASVVDNGDGTWTSSAVTDNGDGTWTGT